MSGPRPDAQALWTAGLLALENIVMLERDGVGKSATKFEEHWLRVLARRLECRALGGVCSLTVAVPMKHCNNAV